MVRVRDQKYKILEDKIMIGIEIECDGCNFNIDNILTFIFKKDDKVVNEYIYEIPILVSDGIICIGKEFPLFDFDDLELDFKLGTTCYEYIFYENLDSSFETVDKENKKIVYKLCSKFPKAMDKAILNLVFYNKGEMVGGTSIEKENLLHERTYYFEYDVPDIEYTEVRPFLVLPRTHKYLFNGYYKKIIEHKENIKRLETKINKKEHEVFVDETANYDNDLKKAEKLLENVKSEKVQSKISISLKNLLIMFKNLIASIPFGLLFAVVIFIFLLILYILGIHEASDQVVITSMEIGFILGIIIAFFVKSFTSSYDKMSNYISKEEKDKKLEEINSNIENIKNKKDDYLNNRENLIRDVDKLNITIDDYNDEVDRKNQDNLAQSLEEAAKIKELNEQYPEYSFVQDYHNIDFEIVNNVIDTKIFMPDEIENYRIAVRNEMARVEKEKQEMALRLKENELKAEENRLLKESNANNEKLRREMEKSRADNNYNNEMLRSQIHFARWDIEDAIKDRW